MPELAQPVIADVSAAQGKLSRREFARRAAFAATTAVVLPATLLSQESAPKPTPSTDQPPQAASTLSPELQAEGELKYQWIIQTYGKRLNEEQKKDLHRLVMEGQKPLAAFRAFPLDNGNMPATVLKFIDAETSGRKSGD
jgi:hypothetical protein